MKKIIIFSIVVFLCISKIYSQCSGGTMLTVNNPSFEGTPGTPHVTPPNWDICQPGVTPDTQPGCWGVTLPPSNGVSYVGFVQQPSGSWYEGASQTLSSPMVAGTTYTFTADLAATATTGGGIDPGCIEMQIWGNMGGNSGCDMTELLWSSGDIFDLAHMDTWVTHTITFTPTQPWGHLLFMGNSLGCSTQPYIMLDNLTPLNPIVDVPAFSFVPVCVGDPVQFTDNSTAGSGTITSWTWDFGDGTPNSNLQSPIHNFIAAGTYNVTLTIITSVPCTSSVTLPITITAIPVVSISPTNPTVCSGTPVTLNATGATTYTWAPATGLSSTTGATVTANPSTTTTYTITGSNSGCTGTSTVTVNVFAIPTSAFTASSSLCVGQNATITYTGSAGVGATYGWNFDGGSIISGSGQGPYVINWSSPGTYNVTLTVSENGCTSTQTSTPVTVYLQPTSPFTVITPVCNGENTTVTYTGNASGSATYTWNFNGGTIVSGSGQGPYTIHYSSTGTYYISLTVSENGCTSTQSTVPVQVSNLNISSTTPTNIICNGQANGSATVNAAGGYGTYTYLWSPSGGIASTASNLGPGIYIINITDSLGCQVSDTVTITEPDALTGTATPENEHCDGSCDGTINLNLSGGTSPYTYIWSNSQVTQNLQDLCAGSYYVTVTDAHNCIYTLNSTINTSTIINASFTANPVFGTVPLTVNFTYTGSTASTYQWNFGDLSPIDNSQNPTHVYNTMGMYNVTLTVNSGSPDFCTDTFNILIQVEDPSYLIIPNVFTPNGDGFNDIFTVESKGLDNLQGVIFNRWGKQIGQWNTIEGGWDGINMHDKKLSPDGVYFYIIDAQGRDKVEYHYNGTVTLIR